MTVTVCIATFGDPEWIRLAERAADSASGQAQVVRVHGDTLAGARNQALEQVQTEHVVFLDADDELEPGYIDALVAGTADVRVPAVQYAHGDINRGLPYVPVVPGHTHECHAGCLPYGNYIVVGAMVRTELLRDIGGWGGEELYEDWAVWLRCHLAGSTFETLPDAVYRAQVRRDSRNRAPSRAVREMWHHRIATALLGAPA